MTSITTALSFFKQPASPLAGSVSDAAFNVCFGARTEPEFLKRPGVLLSRTYPPQGINVVRRDYALLSSLVPARILLKTPSSS